MLTNLSRMLTTAFIWGVTPLIILAATESAVRDQYAVLLVTIVMIVAGASTHAVWKGGDNAATAPADKHKRTGSRRVRRLVDSLSDDELDELRARLSADGEVVPLETLLAEQRRQ